MVFVITYFVKRQLENDIEERKTPYLADKMTAKNSWGIFAFVTITLFTSVMIFLKLIEISFLENILTIGNEDLGTRNLSELVIRAE